MQAALPAPNRVQRTNWAWTTDDNGDGTLTTVYEFETKTKAWGDQTWADSVAAVPSVRATGCTGLLHYHQCSHYDTTPIPCNDPASGYVEVIV